VEGGRNAISNYCLKMNGDLIASPVVRESLCTGGVRCRAYREDVCSLELDVSSVK
jgi:hypothetical protein